MVTAREMVEAFHETAPTSVMLAVLTDEKGLGPADENTYRTLVDKLRKDTRDVNSLQDFLSTPALREVLQSKDNKAWYLPINLNGEMRLTRGPDRPTNTPQTWSSRPSPDPR